MLGITLLYAHIKNRLVLFLINVFWGVDSKSEIHFFGRLWKPPIRRAKRESSLTQIMTLSQYQME